MTRLPLWSRPLACVLLLLSGCGYHVGGTANLLPAEVHTIAVIPWSNISMQYKI
jgi:outer membrane lipopolysaccharide assembly protein LptE/RlpB